MAKTPKSDKKPSNQPVVPKRKRKRSHPVMSLLKWIIILALWAVMLGGGAALWYARDLPDLAASIEFERRPAIIIKAADGATIARYGDLKGESVSVSELPAYIVYAVIATEDRRFYTHHGVDPMGIARAMMVNLQEGRLVQGGSTITQQLAKNLFLSHERTIKRKIQELFLALWLEQQLTKDEILSAYLNRVYMGSGAYGIDAAAQLYFGKSAKEVTVQEAAILAGLLKAPSRFSPLRNPDLAQARAQTVIAAMMDAGYVVNQDDYGPAPQINQKRITIKSAENYNFLYFGDWVEDQLDGSIGTPEGDLVIETTLQPDLQIAARDALRKVLEEHGEERAVSQGALILTDHSGAILAMVGGKDYSESQFNRVTQAQRQPGSAFKPIVYLAALEGRKWKPDSKMLDGPIENGDYRPKNFNDDYRGVVTMEEALAHSLNSAAVRLIKDVGADATYAMAKRLGVRSPLMATESLALGASEMNLYELVGAYATMANDGRLVTPFAITKISDLKGTVFFEREERLEQPRIVEARYARAITDMMEAVVRNGTGRRAAIPYDTAGKTGTSQDYRDALFVGYSDDYVAGVWMGNDDNSPMTGVTGGSLPADVWRTVMEAAHKDGSSSRFSSGDSGFGFGSLLERLTSFSSGAITPRETRGQYEFNE